MRALAQAAADAARVVACLPRAAKDAVLLSIAGGLDADAAAILAANAADVEAAQARDLAPALIDRLRLDPGRLAAIAQSVRAIAALPDPVGEIEWQTTRDDGLEVGRMRVPLGVIAMIYESRPNVTVDAAALCLKSGNAVILRGGSEAIRSNRALAAVIGAALAAHGLPVAAAALVPVTEREAMVELLRQDDLIDLAIPRGGEGLIRFVAEVSRVPVIRHYKGVCHQYVDADADLVLAERLLVDGKTSRPGVCNALETLLVDAAIAPEFLPRALDALRARGVALRGCERTRALAGAGAVEPATDADWDAEYLDLILAVRVVDGLDG
ncbi:MAG TPA: glutamate-5-semialdehyde dehydrogenase, partial [Pseudomonadota bacterium]|nr:glutamate-5-semialdehyde dehydrogenase [Pseudomonadota bacterium]